MLLFFDSRLFCFAELRSTFNAAIFVKQGKHVTCIYRLAAERSVQNDKFSFSIYLCYLVYAPLYIAGPIISFNAFASQFEGQVHSLLLDVTESLHLWDETSTNGSSYVAWVRL
ncbi:hypothetical protein CK203_038556 [Vitis vinifera]|uniref:Uncharacterized protein n=1 Tax=Vitis vinifera TaxID=29760 RepID=A0A438I3Z9_VITVI|nr:hypothetical protein CK203_038556 [Vitis vinifera]